MYLRELRQQHVQYRGSIYTTKRADPEEKLQKSTMSVRKKSNLFLHLCKEYNVLGSITFEYISGKKRRRKSFYLGLSSVLSSSQTIYK